MFESVYIPFVCQKLPFVGWLKIVLALYVRVTYSYTIASGEHLPTAPRDLGLEKEDDEPKRVRKADER